MIYAVIDIGHVAFSVAVIRCTFLSLIILSLVLLSLLSSILLSFVTVIGEEAVFLKYIDNLLYFSLSSVLTLPLSTL